VFENELSGHIPIIHCSVAGCRVLGRLTAGMSLPRLFSDYHWAIILSLFSG
jgi:hypothetical protein